jgi:hypothetical protein
MEFEQVKFRFCDDKQGAEFGGIAVYKYYELVGVICGCCGLWYPAKDVQILDQYSIWLDISTPIVEFHDAAEELADEDKEE